MKPLPRTDASSMQDLASARQQYLHGDPAPAGVRPVVLDSWVRSRAYGVDPRHMPQQEPDPERLRRAEKRGRKLLESAEPLLAVANQALDGEPHLFALADADGLILRILTGPGLPQADFAKANLVVGASWHERDIGCNGVGTALATGEPVVLIGPEHFQESYVGWTCIGVPLRAHGEIAGALDLSVPNDHVHVHTWGWVLSLAAAIEAALAHAAPVRRTEVKRARLDLKRPFHAIRGVFDLLARQLDLPPTHAGYLEQARAQVERAEALLEDSVAQLRQSEERLRRIAESGMIGVLFWQIDGRIVYANDRFLRMVGYTREELESELINWRAMTPPEWESVDAAAIEELRARGVTSPFEKQFIRKDGTLVSVLLSAATFADATDRGVTLVLDMTERKQAEQEIRQAYEEARRAVTERDSVLAVVSHDLRNPLNAITMASSLLLDDIPEDKKQLQVGIIRRAAEQMTRLIEDLVDVARIEGGGLAVLPAREQAGELLTAALEFMVPLAESRGVELRIATAADVTVAADWQRILQVLTNLISNAVGHTAPGGRILLGVEAVGGDEVAFTVADSGQGIDPEHLPRVFDRFWRPPASRRAGAGLGLAIARGIVEAHGGRIWVDSEVGRGSVFRFTLPAEVDPRFTPQARI
jgi:PAS domain S-box-containing protein